MGLRFLRVFIVFGTYFVMWMLPSSDIDFFRSLFILSLGFVYDYWSIRDIGVKQNVRYQEWLGIVGALIAGAFCLIAFLGLIAALTLDLTGDIPYIRSTDKFLFNIAWQLDYFLYVLSIFPFLAVCEIWGDIKRRR